MGRVGSVGNLTIVNLNVNKACFSRFTSIRVALCWSTYISRFEVELERLLIISDW